MARCALVGREGLGLACNLPGGAHHRYLERQAGDCGGSRVERRLCARDATIDHRLDIAGEDSEDCCGCQIAPNLSSAAASEQNCARNLDGPRCVYPRPGGSELFGYEWVEEFWFCEMSDACATHEYNERAGPNVVGVHSSAH